jgi:putative transcriptional regulator
VKKVKIVVEAIAFAIGDEAHRWYRMRLIMSRRCRVVLNLVGGITTACGMLHAQNTKVEDLAAGKVLVMERTAADPVFGESVILLIHYRADGVVGLMLNRAAGAPLSRLGELNGTSNRSDPRYLGGPVELGEVRALARAPKAPPEADHVGADVYVLQTKGGLEAALHASKGPDDLRIYLGYCGWSVPQLQNEVARGSWHIFEHGERFAFDSMPATLWERLIEQTELRLAFGPLLHP